MLARAGKSGLSTMISSGRTLSVTTWNVAAINNNPFEYWLTVDDDPEYNHLMESVEKFVEDPGSEMDVPVNKVFTDDMFDRLERRMVGNDVGWPSVRDYWTSDYRDRKIVSGFLKDKTLGSKRLASMPDRVTNTINVANSVEPVCRPTVINMYGGDLSDMGIWMDEYEKFLFDSKLSIRGKDGKDEERRVCDLLLPIKKSKYPDITEEEEKVSLPLQTLCGAIFDAILVHMMNTVSGPDIWQPIKRRIVSSLVRDKIPNTLEILGRDPYVRSDVIALQEVSLAMVERARNGPLGETHHVVIPADSDSVRDQNSVLFLRKETFPDGAGAEITERVVAAFPDGVNVPVSTGDILAVEASDKDGVSYILASFHGDTNGLATKPVLDAVLSAQSSDAKLSSHRLIFGMDANTYEIAKKGKQQDVVEFGQHFQSKGLSSCWGDGDVDPSNYTTYNARTYLQPQLNKACKSSDKRKNGDVNPKDFVLFHRQQFSVEKTWKDNTGKEVYVEDMAFPTLGFPSDHGILSTVLRPVGDAGAVEDKE